MNPQHPDLVYSSETWFHPNPEEMEPQVRHEHEQFCRRFRKRLNKELRRRFSLNTLK